MRARHWFAYLSAAIAALRELLAEVEHRMERLAEQYSALVGRCRLVLYLKRDRERRPQALYWGRAFRRETLDGTQRLRAHLRGKLTSRTIFLVSYRWSERELFFDFDRRRLVLNRAHGRVATALGRVKLALTRVHLPPAADTSDDLLASRAWRLAGACAAVECDMLALSARRPWPLSLFPYCTSSRDGYLALGWALPERIMRGGRLRSGRHHVASRLSRAILTALHVPRRAWSLLRDTDRRMRALRREHARYARVIGRARRLGGIAARVRSVWTQRSRGLGGDAP